MIETFVIDNKEMQIFIEFMNFSSELLEVTTFTDKIRSHIIGYQFLKLKGIIKGGSKIDQTFLVINKKDGKLFLKPIINHKDLKFRM